MQESARSSRPLSPVEGPGEETGGGVEPAAAGVVLGGGARDGAVCRRLLRLLLILGEVVREGRFARRQRSRGAQRDEDLKEEERESIGAWVSRTFFFYPAESIQKLVS